MEKKYKGNFGELLKLIEHGKITKEHPYYNLYKHIIETNKKTIRVYNIERIIKRELETIKQLINKQLNENCTIPNLEMQPYLIEPYMSVFNKYKGQLNRIKTLEETSNFNNLLFEIYNEFIKSINENQKIIDENIEKNYSALIKECIQALDGIKYRGNYLIEDKQENGETVKTINKKTVKELTGIIDEKDLEAFIILEDFETKRFELTSKFLQLKYEIENNKDIVYNYIINNIKIKIKEYDNEILKLLEKNTKILKKLQYENVITIQNGKYTIKLTNERLRELKITGEIFEILNIRCRLQDIEIRLEEKIKTKQEYQDLSKIIGYIDFETLEPRHLERELENLCNQYKDDKVALFNKIIQAISNIERSKELYKTPTIKKIEQETDTNIHTIYMPSAPGITTRRNALYIVKVLTEIEENTNEFYDFLQNDSVVKLENNEENIMTRIIREKLENYINENEIPYTKKLIKEKNNGK